MPKLNQGRSIQTEANLAKRIAYERGLRGLSYEALADAMTGVGCAINASSIYKIEKGDPPRRISVDELAALAVVFGRTIPNMLLDPELVRRERAEELVGAVANAASLQTDSTALMFKTFEALMELVAGDGELAEYVEHRVNSQPAHWDLGDLPDREGAPAMATWILNSVTSVDRQFRDALLAVARQSSRFRAGDWSAEDQARVDADLEAEPDRPGGGS